LLTAVTLADAGWGIAFLLSLAVVLPASDRLVAVVEAAGDRYRWPAGFVGLLAAAGADGPEVTSSFVALGAGAHDVSLGVILGSNLFNLAAVLGLPILLVGFVAVQRRSLLVSGGAMVLATLLAESLILGSMPIVAGEVLVSGLIVTYAWLLWRESATPATSGGPSVPAEHVGDVVEEEREREHDEGVALGHPSGRSLLWRGLLSTAVIIGGCDVLVNATLNLGPRLGLPSAVTGTFALAALTSLPNVWVAVSLARRHRGAVLVSAVCNSNTINVVFGVCMPSAFMAMKTTAAVRTLDIPALALLTVFSAGLIWVGHGLGRRSAAVIVCGYLVFAALRLFVA
jgi:cation:H+ antiporter